jgi:hypothetical protein
MRLFGVADLTFDLGTAVALLRFRAITDQPANVGISVSDALPMNDAVLNKLEQRLGRLHAKLRLGIEMDHEAQIFGQGINFFHIEN